MYTLNVIEMHTRFSEESGNSTTGSTKIGGGLESIVFIAFLQSSVWEVFDSRMYQGKSDQSFYSLQYAKMHDIARALSKMSSPVVSAIGK